MCIGTCRHHDGGGISQGKKGRDGYHQIKGVSFFSPTPPSLLDGEATIEWSRLTQLTSLLLFKTKNLGNNWSLTLFFQFVLLPLLINAKARWNSRSLSFLGCNPSVWLLAQMLKPFLLKCITLFFYFYYFPQTFSMCLIGNCWCSHQRLSGGLSFILSAVFSLKK